MAEGISARLTPAEARRFGLVVGSAFLLLGLLVWWRGRPLAGQLFGAIGAILILCGITIPNQLRPVHRAWMGLAFAISKVTTPIILGVLYFVVITPIGLVRRALGHNSLKRQGVGSSSWVLRNATGEHGDMKRQF